MIWEPWDSYAMRTATHSIARCRVKGTPIYMVWRLPATRLGGYPNFQAAKAAAMNAFSVEVEC
jgi:hypothetical protein